MKTSILTTVLFIAFIPGFSQNPVYQYTGRPTPTAKKEKLTDTRSLNDISPELWAYMALPGKESEALDELLEHQRKVSPPQKFFIYPQQYRVYPGEYYSKIIDYVSVEVSAICGGKAVSSISKNEILTAEQKNILNTADMGYSSIKIKFRFKEKANSNPNGKIIEGKTDVTVVPESEAEYPGGFKKVKEYFTKNVGKKTPEAGASEKIQQAILAFTVNEEGQVVNAKILKTSTYPKIDQLLLEAANEMPKWRPALNSKGVKVKQEFRIPFGGGC